MYNLQECPIESHLFVSFKHNCIFHLNIEGKRQATIRNRITEKSVARSDGVTSSHTCLTVNVS